MTEKSIPEKKLVSISSKRQLTIPLKYYTLLNFGSEAECLVRDNELVIRPVKVTSIPNEDFSDYILRDLVEEGFAGQELLIEFTKRRNQVRPAVEKMISKAKDAVEGKEKAYKIEDIFGEE